MRINEEVMRIRAEKRKKISEIILSEKLEIEKQTENYFARLCEDIIISAENESRYSLENSFYCDFHTFKDRLTPYKVKILNQKFIDMFLEENKIEGADAELVKTEAFKNFSLVFYKYYSKAKLYYLPINTQLLEELLNKEGFEYDKSLNTSDILTPNFCPITLKKDKNLKQDKSVKQRRKERY